MGLNACVTTESAESFVRKISTNAPAVRVKITLDVQMVTGDTPVLAPLVSLVNTAKQTLMNVTAIHA
jgi:hypothetical protein